MQRVADQLPIGLLTYEKNNFKSDELKIGLFRCGH